MSGEFIDIAVLMHEISGQGFADARFLKDWKIVSSVDPDADLELLDETVQETRREWGTPATRDALLRRMRGSYSGQIQLSDPIRCSTDEPQKELDKLASVYRL